MKKCVIASDSFKGTISSTGICGIARRVIPSFFPGCEIVTIPVADGGEGTVDCFLNALEAEPVSLTVQGPLGDPTSARYCITGDTAVIELASAAGLPLIADRKSPRLASTYGLGQLIADAVGRGCSRILLGLGGSATTDCGCGMAAALGTRFLDEDGNAFVPTGATLQKVRRIDADACRELLKNVRITAMCDVNNPLYGPDGAAFIYGPQKGADPEDVRFLDEGLRNMGEVIRTSLGIRAADLPGAGAAGGTGAGCIAFLGGELRSGTEAVLDAVRFDEAVAGADLVITGEGKLDSQSLQGKLLSGVCSRTSAAGVPLIAIVGMIADGCEALYGQGLTAVFQTNRAGLPFEELALRAAEDYEATLRDVMSLIQTAEKFQ